MKHATWMARMGIVLAGLLAGPIVAAPTAKPTVKSGLVGTARLSREEFSKLIRKFDDVADLMEKSEPDTAKILREAANLARNALIADNMEEVIKQIEKGLMTMATKTGADVKEALDELLKILREGPVDLDKRLKRLAGLKETLKDINRLIEEQKKLEKDSAVSSRGDDLDKRMQAHAQTLANIIKRQKNLLAQAENAPKGDPNVGKLAEIRDEIREMIGRQEKVNKVTKAVSQTELPRVAGSQKKLSQQAARTKAKLDAAAKDPKLSAALSKAGANPKAAASAAAKMSQAGGEMKKASQSLSQSDASQADKAQQNAMADLKAAEKALSDAMKKAGEKTQAGKMGKKQDDLAKKTDALSKDVAKTAEQAGMKKDTGNLSRASGEMKKAGEKLNAQNPKGAQKNMKEALKELEEDKYKLAELRRRMKKKAAQPPQKQAPPQEKLAKDTAKKGEQMKGDKDQTPQPGSESVSSASKSMKQAAGQLSKSQSSQANKSQNEAISDLEKAQKKLQDEIAREEEMAQAEALAKIDQMLRKILESQQRITVETEKAHGRIGKDATYARTDQAKLRELSNGEARLADDVRGILNLLTKEGTTAVFPDVLVEVRGDLVHVQKQLAKYEAGPITQAVQHDIEQAIKDMIDAFKKEQVRRRKKKGGGQGQGKGGGGKQPLVPPIAELKLLRTLQRQINSRTRLVNKDQTKQTVPAGQLAEQHKTLSKRQGKVKTMTKTLDKKMKQAAGRRAGGMGS